MKKVFWLLGLVGSFLYSQVDISSIDLSRLSPEQLKAYQSYISNSSSKNNLQKSQVTKQTVENLTDFSPQLNGIFQPSGKELPDKNLDLSAPIQVPMENKILLEKEVKFTTPLEYRTNEDVYKAVQKDKIKKDKLELKKFGETFFSNKNSVNPYAIPTSENYILTSGDKLSANIYGAQTNNFELVVDRNGNVEVPNVGIIKVGGLTYGDAKSTILAQLGKAYPQSTIVLDIAYYNTIQVFLSGEVKSPGLYNVPSFATVKDLLMVANGIGSSGSYRNITVKRDGKIVEHFDAYKVIQSGHDEVSKLLRNGDVVSVGHANKQVSILGHVATPGIFELTGNETFKHLLGYASNFTYDANKNNIKLTRFSNNESSKVYTLSWDKLLSMKPENGDMVEIFPLSVLAKNKVELKGNIVHEGERELPLDGKLYTLLTKEISIYGKNNFFLENTAFDFAMIKRRNILGNHEIIAFDINDILEKKREIILKEADEIYISSKLQLGENPYVHVSGKVVDKEGRYQYFDNMDLASLFMSVKFKTEILDENNSTKSVHVNKSYIKLTRIQNNKTEVLALNLEKDASVKLRSLDRIEFFNLYDTSARHTANITGEIYQPGVYDLKEGATVQNLIALAGGLTKKAYLKEIEMVRYKVLNSERVRNVINLDFNNPEHQTMTLNDDDQLIVRAIPKWGEVKYIELLGQVKFPGKYPVEDGETLSDIIGRAGGFTDMAFVKGAVFTRKSAQELQQKEMIRSLQELKQQTMYMASVPSEAKESNTGYKKLLLAMVETLEKDAARTVPLGRVIMALNRNMEKFKQTSYDVPVEDGDKLYIPKTNKTITVLGEVMSPNTFIFDEKLSLEDYIQKAGYYKKESADKGSIYVIKSNGNAERLDNGYFLSSNISLEYGDTIIVPKKIEVTSNMSIISAIADITFKLAVTIASLNTVGAI